MNKKEIIIATGLIWPVSSNKWKAPKVIKQLVSDSISLIELEFEKMLVLEKKNPMSPWGINPSAIIKGRVLSPLRYHCSPTKNIE